jgi:hypothetical protein
LAAGLALGLAAGFEAAVGLAVDFTSGFAAGRDDVFGEAAGFWLLAGLAGGWSRNPAIRAGSSLLTSSCA